MNVSGYCDSMVQQSCIGTWKSCHKCSVYDFCSQVICGVNYGKHRNQCLLVNKHHSLMRTWLCKLEELKNIYRLFALYLTDKDLENVVLNYVTAGKVF